MHRAVTARPASLVHLPARVIGIGKVFDEIAIEPPGSFALYARSSRRAMVGGDSNPMRQQSTVLLIHLPRSPLLSCRKTVNYLN